ncbi:DinB family protein [Flexithrix dorotheae]|uniref:DinB family protein n=1 Tax=Flexithrix dorotheae TaxID=70993 RepID=UPI00036137DB|nr:DinB family protein [Flexithrix dorotheae]
MNLEINKALAISRASRNNILKIIESHSIDDLNKIPEGFNNNLVWNFGHIIVTQQLLTYGLAGLELNLDMGIVNKFRKGSKPTSPISSEEVDFLKEKLFPLVDKLEEDLGKKIFENFKTYPTSYGYELNSIQEAIAFNNTHEGMHLGYMLALKRAF